MPKAPPSSPRDHQARRHNPLSEEYSPTAPLKQKAGKKRKVKQSESEPDNFVDSRASQRILQIGKDLVEEEQSERSNDAPNPAFLLQSRLDAIDYDDEEQPPFEDDDDEDAWGDEEDEIIEDVEVDPNDQDIFNRFHPDKDPSFDPNKLTFGGSSSIRETKDNDLGEGTSLADLILEKIAAHEAATAGQSSDNPNEGIPTHPLEHGQEGEPLPPKAVQVYKTVGQLLARQKSGPLPKPMKILTSLPPNQIPAILSLTNPDSWSPHVHLLTLRLFISSRPSLAQPYLTEILLPRVRDDIRETKRLHVHIYKALKKALYKPACFFKGLLFPLLEDADCTLREAHIVSSVLTRVSVPVLHSAAALLRLCDIAAAQFSARGGSTESGGAGGATCVFIRTLLDKRYALPYKVIDALVFYFLRFKAVDPDGDDDAEMDEGEGQGIGGSRLPVLWHQTLLVFAQRYKNDLSEEQREALLDLLLTRGHKAIGPEVRRELLAGRGKGAAAGQGVMDGGDDTMMSAA